MFRHDQLILFKARKYQISLQFILNFLVGHVNITHYVNRISQIRLFLTSSTVVLQQFRTNIHFSDYMLLSTRPFAK